MDESIINIINYLENKDYNYQTIFDDINKVVTIDLPSYNTYLSNYLINIIKIYLNNYVYLCKRFLETTLDNSKNLFYSELIEHKYMPFSKARNVYVDKYLIEKLLGTNSLDLDIMIPTLISLVDDKLASDYKSLMAIRSFVYENQCNDYTFSKRFKSIHKYPSEEEIERRYNDLINGKELNNASYIIGDFAELVTYKKLVSEYPDDKVIWVSKDYGDGYGYDIARYNVDNDHMSLYEVKGTRSANKEFSLTDMETRTFKYASNIKETEAHIMCVYLLNNTIKIVDVFKDKNGKLIAKDENNFDYNLGQKWQDAEISRNEKTLKFVLKKK